MMTPNNKIASGGMSWRIKRRRAAAPGRSRHAAGIEKFGAPNCRLRLEAGFCPTSGILTYAVPHAISKNIPPSIDLRPQCPPVYDQGRVGNCTANAIAGAMEFDLRKQKMRPFLTPSRLFIYYNERAIEGTVGSDAGAQYTRWRQERRQRGGLPGRRVAL